MQHVAGLVERHRPDVGHRPELGERLQHARRPPQRLVGQIAEPIDPLAPHRLVGPVGERIDDRQGKCAQVRQVPQIAFESRDARRFRLLAFQLRDAVAELGRQAVEPPPPPALPVCASAAPDDRRLDDQLFPFPGRPQRAGDHRFLVRVCALRRAHVGRASIVRVLPLVGLYSLSRGPPKHLIARPTVRPSVYSPTAQPRPARPSIAGTCPSDRYSSNRLAERPSQAHASSATKARPEGSGRRVPRSK